MDTATDMATAPSPTLIGERREALDTPALIVDLDVMDANIDRIVATCRAQGVAWRPHCKAHKTPDIAKLQIAAASGKPHFGRGLFPSVAR